MTVILKILKAVKILIKTIKIMGLIKKAVSNLKENTAASPKTTTKGVFYTVGIGVLGLIAQLIGNKYPEVGELINDNIEAYWGVISSIGSIIFLKFAGKKD